MSRQFSALSIVQVRGAFGALLQPTSRSSKGLRLACLWARPCWSWKVGGREGSGQLRFDQQFSMFNISSLQISDYADYTEPLLTHCREMKTKHPDLPLYLMGHSLGGLISLLSVLEAQVFLHKRKN